MEKKDIIILAFVVVAVALNLWLRNERKKKAAAGKGPAKVEAKGGLSGSPDDYEPYSGK